MNVRHKAAAAALGMIFCISAAQAAKVDYIASHGDVAYHAQHLEQHFREGVCTNTGRNVVLRTTPGGEKYVGSMQIGERFTIVDLYDKWAKIEIVNATPDNPKTAYGMIGWISVEYIDCGCDLAAYYAESTPAEASE